ncbi:MAG: dihydrodipicolinate synthase family protein [Chthoniobacterales bacterium]
MYKNNFLELIPAVLTPCSQAGKIDPASMQALCRFLYKEGATGLFVVSSTGEMPLLGEQERRVLIEIARQESGSEHCLYIGVSGTGVSQILEYTRQAAKAGGQVAVVMAPFFLKLDQEQFYQYAIEIADRSPIPVAFYHHLRMPTPIDDDTVMRLAAHPNIIAFKETSGDETRLGNLAKALAGQDFKLFQGSELLVLSTLKQGGRGCVTALANLCPGLHRSLFDAFEAGLPEKAERLQQQLTALWKIFRMPGVERSFGHFVQTLKIPLTEIGIIKSSATMLPAFSTDPNFQRDVLSFYKEWLHASPDESKQTYTI